MKVKLDKEILKGAMDKAGSVSPAAAVLPCLKCVLMDAKKDGSVSITGTNLDQTVVATVCGTVVEEGRALVPAAFLSRVIGVSDSDATDVEIDGGDHAESRAGSISIGAARYSISAQNPDEFPTPARVTDGSTSTADAEVIHDLIGATSYAVSNDATRKILECVHFEVSDGKITAAATDGRRLSCLTRQACADYTGEFNLPIAAVSTVAKVLPREGDLTIRIDSNGIEFEAAGLLIVSKISAEPFPAWRKVVPTEFTGEISFNPRSLASKIAQVMVSASKDAPFMTATFKDGKAHLYMSDMSGTDAKAEMGVDMTSAGADCDLSISMAPKYVLDAIGSVSSATVTMKFINEKSPVVFSSGDFVGVVMPMRVE